MNSRLTERALNVMYYIYSCKTISIHFILYRFINLTKWFYILFCAVETSILNCVYFNVSLVNPTFDVFRE